MYWRKVILILISSILFANNIKDELILDAMLNENINSELSSKSYEKLYNLTKSKSYLEDAIRQGFVANIKMDNLISKLKEIDENNELLTKIKIVEYVDKKDYKKALKDYYKYIKNNEDFALANAMSKQLFADGFNKDSFKVAKDYYLRYENPYSLYLYLESLFNEKKYKEIVKLTDEINKIAEENHKAEKEYIPYLIIRLNALKELKDYAKLIRLDPASVAEHIIKLDENKQYKEIIKLTEGLELINENMFFLTYRAKAISDLKLKSKTNELMNISKMLYENTQNPSILYALTNFFEKDEAKLLELASLNEDIAIKVYYDLKQYDKLGEKLYEKAIKNSDNALLAESYVFSMLANPKEFDFFKIDELIAKGGVNANTINSYAYTLIDENIDIEKGIKLVKIALQEDSENGYFLDTLAWGYYLLNDCENAMFYIQKALKDEKALKEEDIQKHFKKIKKCKK